MAGAQALSTAQLSKAAKASVTKVLAARKLPALPPGAPVGFIPRHWWVGVVMDQRDLSAIAEVSALAKDVHDGMAAETPSLKNAATGAIIRNGNLIIGFVAPDTVTLIQE